MVGKKVIAIIQVRMGSTRLEKKALIDINGKPCLWQIFNRLSKAKSVNQVVVATSISPDCYPIEEFCSKEGIPIYRGSEEDLVDRLYQTAVRFGGDVLIRITGDCPLVDPEIVDKTVSLFFKGDFDYFNNCIEPSFPHGLDVEVFSFKALKDAWENISDSKLRALGTFCLYHNNSKNKIGTFKNEKDFSHIRITLDYEEDLKLLREIFRNLAPENEIFCMEEIIKFLSENPELNKINEKHKAHTRYDDMKKRGFV